jgi:hypothetical protein
MRLFLSLLFHMPILLFAQLESWNGVSFEHEVGPKWGYVIEAEYRWPFDGFTDGSALFLLAGNRALAKNLSITFGSRFEPGRSGGLGTIRLFSDLNYKLPLGETPFTLESRLRYQQDRPPGADGSLRRVSIRPRLGVAADISNTLSAVAELEGRYRFDSRNEWARRRYTFGLEYTLTERLKMELFYRQELRINSSVLQVPDRIVGLYLDYTLPDDRNRDWKYRHPFGRSVTW